MQGAVAAQQRGCSEGTKTPAGWGVCSQQGAAVGMRALWPCHLQGNHHPHTGRSPVPCCCPFAVLPCHPIPTAFLQPDSGFADTAHACPATREGSAPPPATAAWHNSVKVRKVFGIRERGREKCGYHHGATGDASCRAPCSWGWEETSAVSHQQDSVSMCQAQRPPKADPKEITGTLSDWHPAVNAPCHFSVTDWEKTSGIRRVLPSSRLR